MRLATNALATTLLVTLAVALLIAPARAADPAFVGTWGIDDAQCKIPQDKQGAPMVITKNGYDQHEAHCAFKKVSNNKNE